MTKIEVNEHTVVSLHFEPKRFKEFAIALLACMHLGVKVILGSQFVTRRFKESFIQ
tara:strand:- start:906 stop:1073 length:168 start_codon:yes stop_codon:yes gene_type:complete